MTVCWFEINRTLSISTEGLCKKNGLITPGYLCGNYYHIDGLPVHKLMLDSFTENPNPDYFVYGDHRDRNTKNNRIENLRHSTPTLNQLNRGAAGYTWYKDREKWHVQIKLFGKNHHVGFYTAEDDAKYIAKIIYKLAYFYIETLQISQNCDQLTQMLQFIKHIRTWLIFLNHLLLNGKEDCFQSR